MTTNEIVAALDEEIGLLERAKALLSEAEPTTRRRGRPKGSINQQTSSNPLESTRKPRPKLGRAARERISAAQRARWAKHKQTAAPKKTLAKKAPRKEGHRNSRGREAPDAGTG
jgi:hypothetical protein